MSKLKDLRNRFKVRKIHDAQEACKAGVWALVDSPPKSKMWWANLQRQPEIGRRRKVQNPTLENYAERTWQKDIEEQMNTNETL